jgi:site-specific DNA recombinase
MNLFAKKIKCGLCSKNHKKKTQRKKIVYCCSTYDNKGSEHCQRLPISEEFILDYMDIRLKQIPTEEYIKENVELIEVYPDKVVINIKNEDPIIVSANLIQIS